MEEEVVRAEDEEEPEERPASARRPSPLPPRAAKPALPPAELPPREAPPAELPPREAPPAEPAPRQAPPVAPTQAADAPLEHSLTPGEPHAPLARLAPARPLARYEELELLGAGGAAIVRLARDRESGARVAIKRLRREAAAYAERFWREAEAIGRLDHPNVVRLLDVVVADELEGADAAPLALVLELVEGPTLEQVVREEGPLPLAQALELALGVARGLAHAHRQGVIHRDVKPSNVLLAPGGVPKLADFGLALPLEAQLSLTQSGGVLGTLDYMAPEQWEHPHAVDGRADVYGLGATLYRLLTGASPRVIREGRLPAGARALVLRCVEERPQERYASMDELIAALERALARALEDSSGVHEPLARVASQLGRELDEGERAGDARRLRVAALGLQALGLITPEAVRALEVHLAVGSPLEAELPRLVAHTLAAAEARGRERPRLLADAYALLMAALARSALAPAAREALARLGAASREPVRADPAERLAEALGRLAQEGALSALDLRRAAEAGGSTLSALEGALRLLRLRGRAASEAEWRAERARWRRALDVLAAALPEPELAGPLRRERLTLELEAAARAAAAAARDASEDDAPPPGEAPAQPPPGHEPTDPS